MAEGSTGSTGSTPEVDESRVILGDLPDDFLRIMVEVPVPANEGVPPSLLGEGPLQGVLRVTVVQVRWLITAGCCPSLFLLGLWQSQLRHMAALPL